ncbi:MAG: MAPEG family protein [Pseudomonadota bacterium]
MPVTLLYAGLLGLLSVLLANHVLKVRVNAQQYPEWKPNAVLRSQANFVENVPLALVVLFLLEVSGIGPVAVHCCGVLLVLLRVLHALGLSGNEGANYPRLIGAQGTFLLLSIMSMLAVLRSLSALLS